MSDYSVDDMTNDMVADAELSEIERIMGERDVDFNTAYEEARHDDYELDTDYEL